VSEGFEPLKESGRRRGLVSRLRDYLVSGLLVLGPAALSIWVLVKGFTWLDGLLGQYLRFPWFEYRRIPGLGFVAVLVALLAAGWVAHLIAGLAVVRAWERLLARIPLFRVIYNPAKQLGEALLSGKRGVFQEVVLVSWPHPGAWVIGFVTGTPPRRISEAAGCDLVGVFVPKTPNPTSGFYQLVPRERLVPLDLTVEQGLQMVVSGGMVQPPAPRVTPPSSA
jgi:uncharacterized membrane protein